MVEMLASRPLIEVSDHIPLIGCIAFGCIDRGTNLVQVRPISTCPLSCIFCSTNAGPKSHIRQAEYIVSLEHLVEEFRKLVEFKGGRRIEAHIDTVGDPLTYPKITELIYELSQVGGVDVISMQTHGSLLHEKLLDRLSSAGLSRINLSIDSLDASLARKLAGVEWYDVGRIIDLAKYVIENTSMDLLLAPVWVPGVNDGEIPRLIKLACEIKAGRRGPPLGIQKYEVHKHGRKVKGVKEMGWGEFYAKLKEWEELYKVKLILHPEDFGIHKRPMLPTPYRRFEKVKLRVVAPGWLKKERLAVTMKGDRVMTLINAEEVPIGSTVKARIVSNKHNIYMAEIS